MLVVFGDHLPGLRRHQWKNGMVSEADPRLRQVPVLVAGNTGDVPGFIRHIANRPLYCMAPLLLDAIGQPAADRYMNHAGESCRQSETPMLRPADAVIQNQLFSTAPL
jgi:hypothetical protein